MPDDSNPRVTLTDDKGETLIDTDAKGFKAMADRAATGGIAADHLRSFIERIERLNGEKKGLGFDIAAVFAEAKASGFDPKVMLEVIKRRATDPSKLQEFEALLDVYQHALDV